MQYLHQPRHRRNVPGWAKEASDQAHLDSCLAANLRPDVQFALLLGISQATVNHHLIGKMKRGKAQGGAMQKIRKGIRKAMKSGGRNVRRQQVLFALNELLGSPVTRRTMASGLKTLRR